MADGGPPGRGSRATSGPVAARGRPALDGVRLIDKPAGPTSHDVVARVRRALPRGTRVGHAGTLDPFATGLLLVLVGRATRIQRHLMELDKRYEATARLGWTSSTGDPEGELARGRRPPEPLALPRGVLRQVPPAYSAVKVDGVRAYRAARRGAPLALAPREVRVDECAVLWRRGEEVGLRIACSSGTYVRSLVADLGDAYCTALRRTAIGAFDVADADPERTVGIDAALAHLPAAELAPDAARRAAHGVAVPAPDGLAPGAAVVRLRDAAGIVALAEPREDGTLKPVVGFRG